MGTNCIDKIIRPVTRRYIICTDGFMSVPYFPSNDTLIYGMSDMPLLIRMGCPIEYNHKVVNNVLTPVLPSRWSCCEWQ